MWFKLYRIATPSPTVLQTLIKPSFSTLHFYQSVPVGTNQTMLRIVTKNNKAPFITRDSTYSS